MQLFKSVQKFEADKHKLPETKLDLLRKLKHEMRELEVHPFLPINNIVVLLSSIKQHHCHDRLGHYFYRWNFLSRALLILNQSASYAKIHHPPYDN